MTNSLKTKIENRILFLQKQEQLIYKRIKEGKTEFSRARAFGEHEVMEGEIFFLQSLVLIPETTAIVDLNETSEQQKLQFNQ